MRSWTIVALLLLATGAPAQVPRVDLTEPALERAMDGMQPSALGARMRFLADDLLEGRGTASRGHRIAAAYVASELEAFGLQPGVGRSYLQTVPLRKIELIRDRSSFAIVRDGRTQTLEYGTHYTMGGDFVRDQSSVTAPVVYAGFGVTAPESEATMTTRASTCAERSSRCSRGAPSTFPNDERAHYSSRTLKAQNAAQRGVVGMITIRTPPDEARAPWERGVVQSRLPSFRWLKADKTPMDVFPQLKGGASLSRKGLDSLFQDSPTPLETVFDAAEIG